MDTKFQTSFIPKTAVSKTGPAHKTPASLFFLLSVLIFCVSFFMAVGSYAWVKILEGQIRSKEADLKKSREAFEPETLQAYIRLNSRLINIQTVLNNHTAVSAFLDFLNKSTLQSVQFTSFNYAIASDGSIGISMAGVANTYNAIAYQAGIFGKELRLKEPVFSSLDLDEDGNVIFNFTAKIDPQMLYYKNQLIDRAKADSDLQNALESGEIPDELLLDASAVEATSTSTSE